MTDACKSREIFSLMALFWPSTVELEHFSTYTPTYTDNIVIASANGIVVFGILAL